MNSKNIKKIGVLGGTFDPIHNAHLAVAQSILDNTEIEKVIFIPAGQPYHKNYFEISDSKDRLNMTLLATNDNKNFIVSTIDIERNTKTYTIDTIKELKEIYDKDTEFYFIIGADEVFNLPNWKDFKKLFKMCSFLAVARPSHDIAEQITFIEKLNKEHGINITFLETPYLEISSSNIRKDIMNKRSVRYLVPREVEDYIGKHNLYLDKLEKEILKHLKKNISSLRYKHILGVAEEAVRLSVFYNIDPTKAKLCGYLHDIAKEFDKEKMLEMCQNYNILLDEVMRGQPDLAHSFVSAAMAKDLFKIYDKDMLNAISYHTTGRGGMSLLEKVVYIADAIEPNRQDYVGLEEIRAYSYKDIDKAIIISLNVTIDYNNKKSRKIHPFTIQALNYLKTGRKNK